MDTSIHRTAYCGSNGVLIIEVSLYRTVYCGPNGVLSIEVSLYRTVYCGPNGVLSIEVPLYRTVYCGPNGVLIIEVSLYRTVYCGPSGVLIPEVPLYFHAVHNSYTSVYNSRYIAHISMPFRLDTSSVCSVLQCLSDVRTSWSTIACRSSCRSSQF